METDDLDAISAMVNSIARFLNNFGLRRELDELRQRVEKVVAAEGVRNLGMLTRVEYLRESGAGEDEYKNGNLHAAFVHFTALLECIEMLPEHAPLGRGSYEHCFILAWLARCFSGGGQPAMAERRLREALVVIDALIRQQPDDQDLVSHHGMLLADLGDVLAGQGKYQQAKAAYEDALNIAKQQGEEEEEETEGEPE